MGSHWDVGVGIEGIFEDVRCAVVVGVGRVSRIAGISLCRNRFAPVCPGVMASDTGNVKWLIGIARLTPKGSAL